MVDGLIHGPFPFLEKAIYLWDSGEMNILFLLSQRPDSTGSGIYTRAMIHQASKKGHRCSLVAACAYKSPPDLSEIQADDTRLVPFEVEPLNFPIPGMSDVMPYPSSRFMDLSAHQLNAYELTLGQAITDAVRATRPHIIHSNHLWIMSALTRRLFPEIPLVVSCHGTGLRQFRNCTHLRKRVLPGIRGIDGFLALSQSQKHEIIEMFGVDENRVHLIQNGFDPEIFYPAPKPACPPFSLLYAGKLSQSKGVPLLLECMNHPRLRHLPIHLYLAGSGAGLEKKTCTDLALGLWEKVTLCGSLSPHELADRMRKSHLFVLPSFYEGLPLVLIEALASGCSIVSTDLPGTRELVSGIEGDWGSLIDLPPLESIDRPFEQDLPLIRDRLALAIEFQIRERMEKKAPPPDFFADLKKRLGWEIVFRQVESIYQSLAPQHDMNIPDR
ncbi:MAG: glycosyltransferase family 4 protein [Proteobacteria bacterium]|nr:glycosyltransferase family 4 protein [Pseudomonadota bacterium]